MRSNASVLVVVSMFFVGCAALGVSPEEDDSLRITAPANGAFLPDNEVVVRGTTDVIGATEVRINGRFVPVEGGVFEATIELAEGPARISAVLEGHEAAVDVTVDTTDPVVIIESPEPATFSEEQRLHVRGRVDDPNASSVMLNGEEIALMEGGRFDHIWDVAPGAHRIRVEATDRAGRVGRAWTSVIWGDFATSDAPHLDAIVLDIGQDALSTLADGLEPFLASETLEPLLLSANPVVDGFWGHLDVESESHAAADLSFVSREGYLQITLVLPEVHVPIRADLAVGGDITGDVTADRAFVTGHVHVAAANGVPVVTVTDVEVELEGLLIDIHGLFSWIDRNVVTRAAQGRLENQIRAMIVDQVPVRLGEALGGLSDRREFDVAEGTVVLDSSLVSLSATRDGLSASIDMGLDATRPHPDLAERSLGSLVLGTELPSPTDEGSVYAAISADLVNDALHTAWLAGALSRQFDRLQFGERDVTVGTLSLLLPGVGLDLPSDAPVQFYVDAALPPVVGPASDALLAADLADLRVSAFAEVGDELVPLFTASVGAHVTLAVDLGDGAVAFRIPELHVIGDLIDGPANLPSGERLDSLLTGLIGSKIEEMLNPVSLTIPSLYGFSIDAPMAGYETGYLTFAANLRYTAAE
jgi:hypothetical protein